MSLSLSWDVTCELITEVSSKSVSVDAKHRGRLRSALSRDEGVIRRLLNSAVGVVLFALMVVAVCENECT